MKTICYKLSLRSTLAFILCVALSLASVSCKQADDNSAAHSTTTPGNSSEQVRLTGQTGTSTMTSGGAAPVGSLVDGLVARLQANPDDAEGWALLARSYIYLGDKQRAEAARAEALQRGYQGQFNVSPGTGAAMKLPPNHPPLQERTKSDAVMHSLSELIEARQ